MILKALLISFGLFCTLGEACVFQATCEPNAILGSWYFDQIIYKGEARQPFNPELKIFFEFANDGVSTLSWRRENEPGFCERKGSFKFENCGLTDTVTWVNPNNAVECDKDPDMKAGHTTITYSKIDKNGSLRLHLQLGDDELIYILRRVNGNCTILSSGIIICK